MALDFPNAPSVGQPFGNYTWDGEKWELTPTSSGAPPAPFDALAYNGMQINGSMEVSQERGTAGTIAGSTYIMDGWVLLGSGTVAVLASQKLASLFPGFVGFLNCGVTTAQPAMTAGDYLAFVHKIEGWRMARLGWGSANAQPITLGFWTAHHRTGIYSGVVRNSALNRSYAFTYSQTVADTPEYQTVTVPGDTAGIWLTNNGIGMTITLAMACGATFAAPATGAWLDGNYVAAVGQVNAVAATTDAFRLTGLIVLPGIEAPSAARSPLIMRPFDQELLLCQRYYEKSYNYADALGTAQLYYLEQWVVTGIGNFQTNSIVFKTRKRASPTLTIYPSNGGAPGNVYAQSAAAIKTANIDSLGETAFALFLGLSASDLIRYHYTADARL